MPTFNLATDSKYFLELPIEDGSVRLFRALDRLVRKGPLLGGVFHQDLGFLTPSSFLTVVYFSLSCTSSQRPVIMLL